MPDRLIRKIPVIQCTAQRNEAADFRFRAYLKGELDWEDEKLDVLVRETTDTVWQEIDCRIGECPIVFNVWQSLKQQIRPRRHFR